LSYSFKKLLLFEIPYSIFDIQNAKHAKAIHLKGEGFKPGEWKNKLIDPRVIYTDYGWWLPEKGTSDLYGWQEANVNILTDDSSVEPIVGTTTLGGASCNIKKVSKTT